jgi:CRP-like cAMP-binding protein
MPNPTQAFVRNYLLAGMPSGDFALLQKHLHAVPFTKDMLLEDSDAPFEYVYFPNAGVTSIMAMTQAGDRVEAGLFGREGMSGMPILLGADRSPLQTIIQVPGEGFRMDASALSDAIVESRSLHAYLLKFCQAMVAQTAFTTLANVTHPVEVRLARWLLMVHDRTDGDDVNLTHEYMAVMLAVRRPSVTTALHILEGNQFIKATRGIVTMRNRQGLEEFSDGSYGRPEAEYNRLIGPFFERNDLASPQ